jgi:hypothetical protein
VKKLAVAKTAVYFFVGVVLAILVQYLFFGCAIAQDDNPYKSPRMQFDEAWKDTAGYSYIEDHGLEEWRTPEEFEKEGGGDCDCFCVHLIWELGGGSLVGVETEVHKGKGLSKHAIVEYGGEFIEPQHYGKRYDPKKLVILARWDYLDLMRLAYGDIRF